MAIQSQPSRIPEPFAGSGTKNTIPATNATPSASQAASWASGFPPECSQPISAGGCPVPRNDVNGALNQLSQDFAFRQDGGIWEWSALADYDTQRMVRGSDGLLYWSVAQNGPSFASGAVDPTTDDGTYWSSPALKTMPLADKSVMGATTEWVKNLALAPVYLDPAGDDTNDGMSSASAVQTFAKALEIASALPSAGGYDAYIIAASGNYTDSFSIGKSKRCLLEPKGNISLTGNIILFESSKLFIAGNYTTTITPSDVSKAAVSVENFSILYIVGNISISGGSCSNFINASTNSSLFITGTVSADGSPTDYGFRLFENSKAYFFGAVTITDNSTIATLVITSASSVQFYAHLDVTSASTGNIISVSNGSSFFINGVSIVSDSAAIFVAVSYGLAYLYGQKYFAGTVSTAVIQAIHNSWVEYISPSSATGSVTGKRYNVNTGAVISVHSGGANAIPGTIAGTATSSSYGYYG